MLYAQLGSSGLKVSRISLGIMSYGSQTERRWHLSEDEAEPIVQRAVEAGVTFFDTADMYSDGLTEEITGRLLAKLFPRRDDYVLATKVFFPMGPGPNDRGLSRKHLLAGIDDSLRRLGTDYVDLYQIHRWDDETPIEETMAALHDVVRAGKARYLGASTMCAWQFAKAQHTAQAAGGTGLVSMQNRYNLVNREVEREMIPLCLDQGKGLIPYSPTSSSIAQPISTWRRGPRGGRKVLPAASPDRSGVAARQARSGRSHHRSDQAASPHRRARGNQPRDRRRRHHQAGGPLCPALDRRLHLDTDAALQHVKHRHKIQTQRAPTPDAGPAHPSVDSGSPINLPLDAGRTALGGAGSHPSDWSWMEPGQNCTPRVSAPSTSRLAPVMKLAAGLHKNAAARAISSGFAILPGGFNAIALAKNSGFCCSMFSPTPPGK